MWIPLPRRPWPTGIANVRTRARFAFRWLLDGAGLFQNREVGALCIYYGAELAHYSGFTPRYWRFPFLADCDLQIGDTWTDPGHRRMGLASYALHEIVKIRQASGRRFWYVVDDKNLPSIRVIEKAGFELVGKGSWRRPLGIKLLGSYALDDAKAELPRGLAPKSSTLLGGRIR